MITTRLPEILAKKHINILMLSELANISHPTLHSIIQGDAKGIQFETLDKLCRFLEMEPGQLLVKVDLNYHFNRLTDFHYDYAGKTVADYGFAFTWGGKDMISGILRLELNPSVIDEESEELEQADRVAIIATYPVSLRKDLIKVSKKVFNEMLQNIGEDVMDYMELSHIEFDIVPKTKK